MELLGSRWAQESAAAGSGLDPSPSEQGLLEDPEPGSPRAIFLVLGSHGLDLDRSELE